MPISVNGANGITFADGSVQNTGAVGFGFKNRIINGDMRIAQRGTITGAGIDTYGGCDRWKIWCANGGESGRATMSQSTDAPAGFAYSQQIAVTTAQTSITSSHAFQLVQRIEALNLLDVGFGQASKYFTVSFWAKSNKAGVYNVTIFFTGASSNKVNVREVTLSSTWTKYTLTFVTDSTQAIGLTANSYIQFGIGLMAGSQWRVGTTSDSWAVHDGTNWNTNNQVNFFDTVGNTINVTGVQFEKGSTATDFDYRDYGRETQLCQRYCYKLPPAIILPKMREYDRSRNNMVILPVQMRATVTVASMATTDGISVTVSGQSDRGFQLYCLPPGDGYGAQIDTQALVTAEL